MKEIGTMEPSVFLDLWEPKTIHIHSKEFLTQGKGHKNRLEDSLQMLDRIKCCTNEHRSALYAV